MLFAAQLGRGRGRKGRGVSAGNGLQFSRVLVVAVGVRPRGRHENLCRRPLGAIIYTCLIKIENNGPD